jgi:outer membrane protein
MTMISRKPLLALAFLTAAAMPALAADLPGRSPAPAPAPIFDTFNPWQVRVRALGVLPDANLNINQIPTANAKASNSVVPELDISYYFTRNISAELILGVTPHKVTGTAAIAGVPVGKSTLLPPTLTAQYHFTNFGAFQPYLGAGVNYTWFLGTTPGGTAVTALNIKSSPGLALQAGFDYMLNANWGVNVDVKKLWLRPDITGNVTGTGAITGNLRLDPWIVGAGITYRFGSSGPVVAKY